MDNPRRRVVADWPDTSRVGRVNVYVCPRSHESVTVDVDAGVTPATIPCLAPADCPFLAVSKGYPPFPDGPPEPTHEWFRPNRAEYRRSPPGTRAHIDRGGLLLRPARHLNPPPREAP